MDRIDELLPEKKLTRKLSKYQSKDANPNELLL
jgi:hypothetical protein